MSRLVVPLSSSPTDDGASDVGAESDCIWFLDTDKDTSERVVHLAKVLTCK